VTISNEAIPSGAFEAARTGMDKRLTWGSLHWPELPPDLLDEITTAALSAAAPLIEAQAWDAVIARIDLGTSYMVDEKYVAGAEWVKGQIIDVLRARADQIDGGSK